MYGHTPALGDIAANRVSGNGLTTTRHACHQVTHALNDDITTFLPCLRSTALGGAGDKVLCRQFDILDFKSLNCMYNLADSQVAIANCGK
jgi:hypothetical protein